MFSELAIRYLESMPHDELVQLTKVLLPRLSPLQFFALVELIEMEQHRRAKMAYAEQEIKSIS